MGVLYSEQRERQLRIVLWIVQGLVAVFAVVSAYMVAKAFGVRADDAREQASAAVFAIALALPAMCLYAASRTALQRLPGRGSGTRLWAATTGVLVLLSSLPFLTGLPGLAILFLGMLLLCLALMTDGEQR